MKDLAEKIVRRDIRAKTPEPLNEDFAYKIGISLGRYWKGQAEEVIIGYDMRLSSPNLSKALAEGISRAGLQVQSLGLCGTEMISFASGSGKTPAVMITASHNPPDYNGFKIIGAEGLPVETSILKEIVREAELSEETTTSFREVPLLNIDDDYIEKVLLVSGISQEGYDQEISVVIESGNGIGGRIFQKAVSFLGWLKPAYYSSRIVANTLDPCYLEQLTKEVADNKVNLGICFDGDADRVAFAYRTIGGEVKILTPSQTGALIIRQVLRKENKESKVFYSLVASALIPELVETLGREARMTPVGQVGIRTRASWPQNGDYVFATEHSGHYYYRDFYWADSGMISALIILDMCARLAVQARDFSSIVRAWETRFFQSEEMSFSSPEPSLMEERINYVRNKMKADPIQEYAAGDPIDTKKILKARYSLDDYSGWWWFCLRPSGTEPELRLILEVILNKEMPEIQRIKLGPKILAEKTDQLVNLVDKERRKK